MFALGLGIIGARLGLEGGGERVVGVRAGSGPWSVMLWLSPEFDVNTVLGLLRFCHCLAPRQ